MRALVAFLLSALSLGLGHLFAGEPWRALVLLPSPLLLLFWANACFRFAGGSWQRLTLALAVALLPAVLVSADAWRVARRGKTLPLGRAARIACYVGFFVASAALSSVASRALREHWLQAMYMPSASMSPTLLPGDRFMVDQRAYLDQPPARGDVVMYWRSVKDGAPPERFVGRVEAVPGDGIPEKTETLPPDRYFIVGDNTGHALDSHILGPVDRAAIAGRVLYVSLSIDPQTNELRFARTGTLVK